MDTLPTEVLEHIVSDLKGAALVKCVNKSLRKSITQRMLQKLARNQVIYIYEESHRLPSYAGVARVDGFAVPTFVRGLHPGGLFNLVDLVLTDIPEDTPLPNAIGDLSALTSLTCEWCFEARHVVLPPGLGALSNLCELQLEGQFCRLDSCVSSLVSLTHLAFRHRLMKEELELGGELTNLVELSLNGDFETVPDSISLLTSLTILELIGRYDTLPNCISLLTNLEELAFVSDQEGDLVTGSPIGFLTGLTHLHMQFEGGFMLEDFVSNLTALAHLYLGTCEEIPDSAGALSNLQTLELMNYVPRRVTSLTNLQELAIDMQQDTLRHDVVSALVGLTSLWLHSAEGPAPDVPDQISGLTNLKSLGISYDEAVDVPIGVSAMTGLTSLYLGWGRMTRMPQVVLALEQLRQLTISFNSTCFELVADDIEELSRLTTLQRLKLRTDFIEAPYYSPPSQQITVLTQLTSLVIDGFDDVSDLMRDIGALSRVELLELTECKLGNDPTGWLDGIASRLPRLKAMALHKCGLAREHVPASCDVPAFLQIVWF